MQMQSENYISFKKSQSETIKDCEVLFDIKYIVRSHS